jgi:hypothetical protein
MKASQGVRVWPVPIALGILTSIGLVAALVADGIWDAVSWIGLGVPLAVVLWFVWIAPGPSRKQDGRTARSSQPSGR